MILRICVIRFNWEERLLHWQKFLKILSVAVAAVRSRGTVIAPKAAVIVADGLPPSNPGRSLLSELIDLLKFHRQ